ncbi:MAG TPA: rhodanese-like domain-containing protein [Candidatus Polarisedimenticolaceae bacterium]|nr:rhodanese-like domain-containing protein [Candidatus Polarisedimenticolaceae bacterium]
MDRWWSDGTENGSRLWQGILGIMVLGIGLGMAQNVLVRMGSAKDGLAWRYEPQKLDTLDDVTAKAASATPPPAAPAANDPTNNDPLGLGAQGTASGLDVPDLPRPIQIQLPKVKEFFDAKAATFVDARDPEEYAGGHIPGAVSLPGEQATTDPARLEKFDPRGKPIIVYCGGGTCELSMNLGFALVAAGKHKVLVFTGGWPEWSGASYPVEKGAGS